MKHELETILKLLKLVVLQNNLILAKQANNEELSKKIIKETEKFCLENDV